MFLSLANSRLTVVFSAWELEHHILDIPTSLEHFGRMAEWILWPCHRGWPVSMDAQDGNRWRPGLACNAHIQFGRLSRHQSQLGWVSWLQRFFEVWELGQKQLFHAFSGGSSLVLYILFGGFCFDQQRLTFVFCSCRMFSRGAQDNWKVWWWSLEEVRKEGEGRIHIYIYTRICYVLYNSAMPSNFLLWFSYILSIFHQFPSQ